MKQVGKTFRTFRALGIAGIAMLVALVGLMAAAPTRAQGEEVVVSLIDAQQRIVGSATLTEMDDDMVEIAVEIAGMNPVPGDHLFGVAEMGICEAPDFASAGDLVESFPNVQFYASGAADYKATVDFDLSSLMDGDGSALVLYADTDEESARIICGVAAAPGEMAEEEEEEEPAETAPTPTPMPAEDDDEEEDVEEPSDEDGLFEERTFVEYLSDGAGVFLYDANGRVVGIALMFTDDFGYTDIELIVEDMEPVPGDHVMAITEFGQCDTPDFASAGDDEYVFDQTVQFFANGSADFYTFVDSDDLDVRDLFDDDGSALVLYADKHDNPGPRIICGAILPFPDFIESFGITVEDFAALLLED